MTTHTNPTARTTKVDGFAYNTTAPERGRLSRAAQHYVDEAANAEAGVTLPAQELVIVAAEAADRPAVREVFVANDQPTSR